MLYSSPTLYALYLPLTKNDKLQEVVVPKVVGESVSITHFKLKVEGGTKYRVPSSTRNVLKHRRLLI